MKSFFKGKEFNIYVWIAVIYFIITGLVEGISYPESAFVRVINLSWQIIFILFFNFVLFEFTLPFLRTSWKKLFFALPLIIAHLLINSFGLYLWREIGVTVHVFSPLVEFKSLMHGVTAQASLGIPSIIFFGVLKHFYNYRKLKLAAQQLTIEKQQAELNFLKSQINPHFLFNTLNNIYSLARDKSDAAPESILRLSKILRFILKETRGEFITVEQELKLISDYIELEKLRYDDTLEVSFNYEIEDVKQAIPPFLLIPFVENAFKHGVSEAGNSPFISINLSVNRKQLSYIVKNSSEPADQELKVKENIGLANLRRQLELLYREFSLNTLQKEATFTAELKINLASHVQN
ncbi:MAG: histidine kinase [Bacteroidetes bacterium]|nr:histidine kinase [Bacteroidota bacterium]